MSAEYAPFMDTAAEQEPLPTLDNVVSAIRADAFEQYEALEYTYNRLSNDEVQSESAFPSNYAHASELLETTLLTQRIQEFMSSTWRGAPIYEAFDEAASDGSTIKQDVNTAAELFGHTYGPQHNKQHADGYSETIETTEGPVTYRTAILASRQEIDPAAIPEADNMVLVGHFVFEQQAEASPRCAYVLLEALRPPRQIADEDKT